MRVTQGVPKGDLQGRTARRSLGAGKQGDRGGRPAARRSMPSNSPSGPSMRSRYWAVQPAPSQGTMSMASCSCRKTSIT